MLLAFGRRGLCGLVFKTCICFALLLLFLALVGLLLHEWMLIMILMCNRGGFPMYKQDFIMDTKLLPSTSQLALLFLV